MKKYSSQPKISRRRSGAALVEMACVLPVFVMFLFTLFEFAHFFMVQNLLKAATTEAARQGTVDGASTAQVQQRVNEIIGAALDTSHVTVLVKDASVFDDPEVDATGIDYAGLSNIDLAAAESRQLFLIRAEVDYHNVALFPPMWVANLRVTGQSVMRHE
ncbi:MAG: TadE/TadG family type IV pilus assembly protein [Planctomycetaceae bacterium]